MALRNTNVIHNTSNQSSNFRLSPLCYSILFLLFMSLPAIAAESEDSADALPSTTLDTIVVTVNPLYAIDPSEDNDLYNANVAKVGTKIPDYLENIPQSISVITQAKIDDLNLDTLDQIAKRTTGLRVLKDDDGRSSIYSRGYEYDQYSIDGLASPMASINDTLPNLVAFDRVEVMRGTSGLFNSASEVGGVVNLVRKRGKANISNPECYGVSAGLQGSLSADDSLIGRTVLQYNQRSNSVVDDICGKYNQNGTTYVSVDKQLNDTSKFGLGYLM